MNRLDRVEALKPNFSSSDLVALRDLILHGSCCRPIAPSCLKGSSDAWSTWSQQPDLL